jgi:hypothetical protein
MAWKRKILVVANVTAASDELLDALCDRAQTEPAAFTLIVPATTAGGGGVAAQAKLTAALERLRAAGLQVDGAIGDGDPTIAVTEAWDPRRYDEIIVSTLPSALSKWLQTDLPHRISKLTGAPVSHVESAPPRPVHETVAAKLPEKHGVMTPLNVLAWGGGGHDTHSTH